MATSSPAFMADRMEAQHAASNASSAWLPAQPAEFVHAVLAKQAAYVAYLRAYAARYPAEAHMLPDAFKGRQLPEHAAFVAAANAVDALR